MSTPVVVPVAPPPTGLSQPAPSPSPAPSPPPPSPPPPPARSGTFRQLGTQTLAQFLTSVRASLPEGLDAANARLMPVSGILAFCGATIWRDKYSLGIAGGHGDSFDDGHYAQDLKTGNWEILLPPSSMGMPSRLPDSYGEWLPERPAAQHSYGHLLTVGDDIVQGYGYAVGNLASAYRQAHRWHGASAAWQRYGRGGSGYNLPYSVLFDSRRNRIVRFALTAGTSVDVIDAGDPNAAWETIPVTSWPDQFGIYGNIGYHVDLDCFVLSSQHDYPNRVWVMTAADIRSGWVEVPVRGSAATPMTSGGLEYMPPQRSFASADQFAPDVLYYLTPTGSPTDAWTWTSEAFSGSTTPAAWELVGIQGKLKWSTWLNGLVAIKSANALTEVFTPS
jgi:hypothetical protein